MHVFICLTIYICTHGYMTAIIHIRIKNLYIYIYIYVCTCTCMCTHVTYSCVNIHVCV